MRRIGTLSSEREAQAFSDYLFTLKIDTQVSGNDGAWDVWLLDEDQLHQGRSELEAYRAAPSDPKYVAAAGVAKAKRDAELQAVMSAAKQQIDLRKRWERPVWLNAPVTFFLVGMSVLVTLLCQFGSNHEFTAKLYVQTVTADGHYVVRPALFDVRHGEVWRLISPIFIHLSPLHLIFNMMWTLMLGRMVEHERGWWRLALYVLLMAVVSNVAQTLYSSPLFGGMSGVVYGLFGYVWVVGRLDPNSGLQISRESAIMMVVLLILCTTGALGPIANAAHFVGLGVGLALAGVEVLYRGMRA